MQRLGYTALLALLFIQLGYGQRSETVRLPLADMSAFQPQAGNWSIVGGVAMNPAVDIHDDLERAVQAAPGTGILFNNNTPDARDHLLTAWEHGDIILELEVMMPKGSNSGIYLQGRYEVQLLDSWGVSQPSFSDIGGIYRNWEQAPELKYMGKAPLVNAAKAPGLWQQLKIVFQAPRFDASGAKVSHARLVSVDLNGVRIHENVEIPRPTGGPVSKEETALGPLMIQGDHGPVAFRNIRYQLLRERPLEFRDLTYELFEGGFEEARAVALGEKAAAGPLDKLSLAPAGKRASFGMIVRGSLSAKEAGAHQLLLKCSGGLKLTVANQPAEIPMQYAGEQLVEVKLEKGDNPIELVYYKNSGWLPLRLGVFNATSHPQPLHAMDALPTGGGNGPILDEVGNRPRMLRAFLDFEGDRQQRLTHAIGVGGTNGVHYAYDLKTGSPACVWRGDFVDATPMWQGRGDGSFRPLGSPAYLFTGHSFARLKDSLAAFPSALDEAAGFRNKGYKVAPESGYPVFLYEVDTFLVSDHIRPDAEGKGLVRQLTASAPFNGMAKLAEGQEIVQLTGGLYVVDRQYYVQLPPGVNATVRKVAGQSELVMPFGKHLEYNIKW